MDGNNIQNTVSVNIFDGNNPAKTLNLADFNKPRVTFGRDARNDIVLTSTAVSDFHGYFQLTNVGWVVFDADSLNGILVDDKGVKDAPINNGTHIRINDLQSTANPGVSIFVDLIVADNIKPENTANRVDGAVNSPPKKKSKAPIIIVIVVVALLIPILVVGGLLLGGAGIVGMLVTGNQAEKVPVSDIYTVEDESDVDVSEEEYTEEATDGNEGMIEITGDQPEIVPQNIYCEQFVLVKCEGTYATLTYYEKEDDAWFEKMTMNGRIGKNGITANKVEGDGCTPEGEYELTFCCGLYAPDTDMDFQTIDEYSVWVDDTDSYYYNTLQSEYSYYCDWSSAEPMYDSYFKGDRHNYCINIAANGDGITTDNVIPGNGSVITLCGKNETLAPTHGCVDISGDDMIELLRYLDSSKSPEIIIY